MAIDRRNALPDKLQTLLLKASLLEGEAALHAYSAWRQTVDIDDLEFGAQRVLPLLCKNLSSLGVDDPLIGRFRGVARYGWYLNQILINAASPLLHGFREANIPVVLLKGMAFIAAMPDQLAMRSMQDIDLLVRPEHAPKAVDLLAAHGWRPYYGPASFVKQELIERTLRCDFTAGRHRHIDLHWYAIENNCWPDVDKALWTRLMPVAVGEQACFAPSFEDQVLHACVHGAPWNGIGTIRWVTDCTMIIRERRESFDWAYFVDQVRERRVAIQVRNCLGYLQRTLAVPVPPVVLDSLRDESVSFFEVLDYHYRARNPANLLAAPALLVAFQNFRASSKTLVRPAATGAALNAWLKRLWMVDSPWLALLMLLCGKLNNPSWLRRLVGIVWRRDWWTDTLSHRKLFSISTGVLDLSFEGDPAGSLLYGWSDPEADGRWTNAKEAAIAVDVGKCGSTLNITLHLSAFLTDQIDSMSVDIWANREQLPSWHLNSHHSHMHRRVLAIPKDLTKGRYLVLTFIIRRPRSPASLGLSNDTRQLGLFIRTMQFVTATDHAQREPAVQPEPEMESSEFN